MIYQKETKKEIERVIATFHDHIKQSQDYDLLWSNKVGYVLLSLSGQPHTVESAEAIQTAEQLCDQMLHDVAMDALIQSGSEHTIDLANANEIKRIKKAWDPYIKTLPDYAYLCDIQLSKH